MQFGFFTSCCSLNLNCRIKAWLVTEYHSSSIIHKRNWSSENWSKRCCDLELGICLRTYQSGRTWEFINFKREDAVIKDEGEHSPSTFSSPWRQIALAIASSRARHVGRNSSGGDCIRVSTLFYACKNYHSVFTNREAVTFELDKIPFLINLHLFSNLDKLPSPPPPQWIYIIRFLHYKILI